ncbi:ATP synthase subunit beta [Thioclava dalianensis]|uniref:ATP synthase subunit beta n=1 Tax=Thioclava dalianensis TaxID=1185766 RepID=A0A074U357_9RHOB|nr:SAM-dependent methyltransferase [Thioclava dalianensis]KEP69102.1 ATP synthase subunit beta [Thioclava dalianensis]SFM84524.1 SAM-dependent methyltransferase, MidA family [Thioclava dalianensis]
MSGLKKQMAAQIATEGPMRLDRYMASCLLHPDYGYYATRDPFGTGGDFITAPEISQMFGEMIGLCLAQSWLEQGRPDRIVLAEAGPGRGTLMADILRAMRAVPGLIEAASIHLIEASPTLREIQRATLAAHPVHWHESIKDLPSGPLYFVANEFLDALPIRQFERAETGWAERQVGAAPDGTLHPGLSPPARLEALEPHWARTRPGDVIETCVPATAFVETLAARIAAQGGCGLLVDYGNWRSLGDTFQALRNHQPVDPFAEPGEADLTAHVAFEPLAEAATAAGALVSAMTPQGVFLERLGIAERARMLAGKMSGAALENHIAAHRRLTHPAEMGQLFQTLALVPQGAALPPGFDPA